MAIVTVKETLEAKLARLETENAALKNAVNQSSDRIYYKITVRGQVSVYGLAKGRYPVTLSPSSWVKLILDAPNLTSYLANNAELIEQAASAWESLSKEEQQAVLDKQQESFKAKAKPKPIESWREALRQG